MADDPTGTQKQR